jgi:hypothetical protein
MAQPLLLAVAKVALPAPWPSPPQVRVQLAALGFPLLGDALYAALAARGWRIPSAVPGSAAGGAVKGEAAEWCRGALEGALAPIALQVSGRGGKVVANAVSAACGPHRGCGRARALCLREREKTREWARALCAPASPAGALA